mmetsp:Transcript_44518/g.123236  ORF Transcript_44518/g.123236 Transcript_44518/m.123236 type:complete len:271 (+) Transcript_44518:378-1190(+)
MPAYLPLTTCLALARVVDKPEAHHAFPVPASTKTSPLASRRVCEDDDAGETRSRQERRNASFLSPAEWSVAPGRPNIGIPSTSFPGGTPKAVHSPSASSMSLSDAWCGSPRLRMEYARTVSQSMNSCTNWASTSSFRPGLTATLKVLRAPPLPRKALARSRHNKARWYCSGASKGSVTALPPAGSSACHSISAPSAPHICKSAAKSAANRSRTVSFSDSSSRATSSGWPRRLTMRRCSDWPANAAIRSSVCIECRGAGSWPDGVGATGGS